MSTNSNNTMKAMPIFLAFLCMGFGDVVGPMVSLAKDTFHLSTFMAQLLPLMGFIMFGLLSVPMGLFQDRKGKKYLLTLGLLIAFSTDGVLTASIQPSLVMALYVYALGAVGGPLKWILNLVNKIPLSWLLVTPLFSIPWYIFGWPSEKLYNFIFYKFNCLEMGLRYVQNGEYRKAIFELEHAKVRKDDFEGQKALYSSLGDAYGGISDY